MTTRQPKAYEIIHLIKYSNETLSQQTYEKLQQHVFFFVSVKSKRKNEWS